MSDAPPLARSARNADSQPQPYGEHVGGTVRRAREDAQAIAACMSDPAEGAKLVAAVEDGATFHDLGKLDRDNQAALRKGRKGRMRWDHIDAGVAHLLACKARVAAWLVRAHHAPGLPAESAQFNPADTGARGLRGGRFDDRHPDEAEALTAHTDRTLPSLLAAHEAIVGTRQVTRLRTRHGLFMRLALSCQVDADHADSAWHDHGRTPPGPVATRWPERLARLHAYVEGLPKDSPRQADRDAFHHACRTAPIDVAMVACEGPVGIGKTTAVMAWCLRRAAEVQARRIFIVAPYTTILSQTAATLRKALLLPGEEDQADRIVAEHHHRADFDAPESRDLALLWQAPVVVTTSVQFFETLAACEPARLRKLHSLPGSVVFLDEAHTTLPAPLWRQNWAWMQELASGWGCSFVFASGSLARVWQEPDVVGSNGIMSLPDLAPAALAARLDEAEHARVRYRTLGLVTDPVQAIREQPGPRLAVFNTVQTTAVVADRLRQAGADVLHLSTALCPADRTHILAEVQRRLAPGSLHGEDWTLVATSLVEAGVDLSFRTGLRERFSTASLIQLGGRVNRHGRNGGGEVLDFVLRGDGAMSAHRGAARSIAVLASFFAEGRFDEAFNPATLVTEALRREVRDDHGNTGAELAGREGDHDYPGVARLGRLIDTDTMLVVVDATLRERLASGAEVGTRELLAGSVSIWSDRQRQLGLDPLPGRPGIHVWTLPYEPRFLGYMAGVLRLRSGGAGDDRDG